MTLYTFAENTYKTLLGGEVPFNKEAYRIINSYRFEELVKDDRRCVELIRAIIEFPGSFSGRSKNRGSHILITWLLGIGIARAFHLDDYTKGFEKQFFTNLWLQSAMLHDYGYFQEETYKEGLLLENITRKYNLLSDSYTGEFQVLNNMSSHSEYSHFFTYSYEEIKNYHYYSQEYRRKKKEEEKNDHGIIGGCLAFRKYCEQYSKGYMPSIAITQMQKIACIITASHNIYKSPNAESDSDYQKYHLNRLLSSAPVLIDKSNILLFLLSLVDTIECTKRFSKKENHEQYLNQKTTLKYVDVFVNESVLIIDYSNLDDYITKEKRNKKMREKLQQHAKGVWGLSTWTTLNTNRDERNEFRIEISL